MMAIVAEGESGRVYLPPTQAMENLAKDVEPAWVPEGALVKDARAFTPILYGLLNWSDLFTGRQITALTTFYDPVKETKEKVLHDALDAEDSTMMI